MVASLNAENAEPLQGEAIMGVPPRVFKQSNRFRQGLAGRTANLIDFSWT
jgi:hypothetical protein